MSTRSRLTRDRKAPNSRKPIKKRKYSRAGCDECKRRKMKCDEGKPECYNCSRLRKTCVYRTSDNSSFSEKNHKNGSKSDANDKRSVNDSLPVKHYQPTANGAYLNSFVSDTNSFSGSAKPSINGSPSVSSIAITKKDSMRSAHSPDNSPRLAVPSDLSHFSAGDLMHEKYIKKPLGTDYGEKPLFTNAISDILTPSDTSDYVINQHDLLEMKNLFNEASLLVSDMNDLDLLNGLNNIDETLANPLVESRLKALTESPMVNAGSPILSDLRSVSDTYEKHDFQVDDFSKRVINNHNNGNYLAEYDMNSPQVINVNHLQETHVVPNSVLIEKLIDQHSLTDPHIKYIRFLNDPIMSLNFFPFASSIENNEVVNLLVKYANNCPYLLSALLSMSATVLFNTTGKAVHELSSQKYISVCLKALSQAFSNGSRSKVDQFLNDIERLLLTVLVLTSNFSSINSPASKDNILNSWKTHLRGAKDLLVNYSNTTKSQHRLSISGGLALAKTWFFAIESLAGQATMLGGTLTRNKQKVDHDNSVVSLETDEESQGHNSELYSDTGYFDKSINHDYHDALLNIGLLTSGTIQGTNEFHLFLGFTMEVVLLIEEFTKSLDIIRANNLEGQLSANRVAKLLAYIHRAHEAIVAPKVNLKTFEIPPDSPVHPKFRGYNQPKMEYPESGYCEYVQSNNKVTYYSYFDISQQCHTDIIYLRILVLPGFMKLPKSHPFVQELVERLMGCLIFVLKKDSPDYETRKEKIVAETDNYFVSSDMFDTRAFMIQSPYRLIMNLVRDSESLEKIETFFLGLVKLGNGSALSALKALEKRKESLKGGEVDSDEIVFDNLIDHHDTVPFV